MSSALLDNTSPSPTAPFDGIICIGGEDWWYHNRGHFDFQIMRRLAKRWPVLFVNSLGVRIPSIGDKRVFASRISRKLKSLSRGITRIENEFWVYSPFSIPGRLGQSLSNSALSAQINLAARRIGIKNPLLWVHCPAGAKLIHAIPSAAVVLQRTDRFETFPEGDPVLLGEQISELKEFADLVVYAAPHLMDEERAQVKSQLLVTHGVDFDTFKNAAARHETLPPDLQTAVDAWQTAHQAQRPPKRVGFIGGLDAHTFDPTVFNEVAARLPDMQFILVGGSSLPENWCPHHNVVMLGRKPYDEVASYMANMDVLIMPWNKSDWIKACNPIKLKEYLATGRPVITRDFEALAPWRKFVTVADTADEFVAGITAVTAKPYDGTSAQQAVQAESWDAKADRIARALLALNAPKLQHAA